MNDLNHELNILGALITATMRHRFPKPIDYLCEAVRREGGFQALEERISTFAAAEAPLMLPVLPELIREAKRRCAGTTGSSPERERSDDKTSPAQQRRIMDDDVRTWLDRALADSPMEGRTVEAAALPQRAEGLDPKNWAERLAPRIIAEARARKRDTLKRLGRVLSAAIDEGLLEKTPQLSGLLRDLHAHAPTEAPRER